MILISVVSVIETNCIRSSSGCSNFAMCEAMQNLKDLQASFGESFSKALLISEKCIYDNISSLPVVKRNSSLGWIKSPAFVCL